MAPKKKGQKLALNDFLANDTLGSWADEMDALPTAPAPRPEGESMGSGDFMSRPDARGRGGGFDDSRPPREELPLPTQAPWTAFVGNLAFDVGEGDVAGFFDGLSLNSVKIISDMEGKPKGFGYVEFATLDQLKKGLSMTGSEMAGRSVRVSVAEPPKGGSGARRDPFASNAADEADQWRRSGPLPPISGGNNSARPSANRYENSQPDGVERDWSAARGSKFVPSAPVATQERPARSGGFVSESAAVAEAASQWRSNKPAATAPPLAPGGGMARDAPPHQRGSSFRQDAPPGPADTEAEWTRGGKFVPSVDRSAASSRRGSGQPFAPSQVPADDSPSDWRSSVRGPLASNSRQGSFQGSRPTSNEPSPQPAARRPLNLAARSANPTPSPSTPASPDLNNASPSTSSAALPSAPKFNPFGAAKPVDASARDKAAEEKMAKQANERKERLKKEQEAKAATKNKEREFVRAPVVKGAGGKGASSSPKGAAAAPEIAPAGKEEESKLGPKIDVEEPSSDDFKSVSKSSTKSSTPASASTPAEKETKEEKKVGSAYAGLEIEGGDDDDEEEAELVEGVKKVEV